MYKFVNKRLGLGFSRIYFHRKQMENSVERKELYHSSFPRLYMLQVKIRSGEHFFNLG